MHTDDGTKGLLYNPDAGAWYLIHLCISRISGAHEGSRVWQLGYWTLCTGEKNCDQWRQQEREDRIIIVCRSGMWQFNCSSVPHLESLRRILRHGLSDLPLMVFRFFKLVLGALNFLRSLRAVSKPSYCMRNVKFRMKMKSALSKCWELSCPFNNLRTLVEDLLCQFWSWIVENIKFFRL